MLNKISEAETNAVWSHLYVESLKKKKSHRKKFVITRGKSLGRGEVGELDEGGQKLQTSILYTENK